MYGNFMAQPTACNAKFEFFSDAACQNALVENQAAREAIFAWDAGSKNADGKCKMMNDNFVKSTCDSYGMTTGLYSDASCMTALKFDNKDAVFTNTWGSC